MRVNDREKTIEENRREYGEAYHGLKWPTADEARRFSEERTRLLEALSALGAEQGYGQSKIDCRKLSPGCRSCGEGNWSCLFVNGICNSACFYCPAPQNERGFPSTNTVSFENPADYGDYLQKFNIKGVSISGGEPLLTLRETLSFIREVRRRFGGESYLWLYTNGILLTEEIVDSLRKAGLHEIRFDIGARQYRLDRVKLAVGRIPHVTVEIPAIPEDQELLKGILKEMKSIGVDFLNLHQLRLTPHNFRHLSTRKYTFVHGPKVTVLESELTALKVLKYNLENEIDLPINYCSFPYKSRYQARGNRLRYAPWVKKEWEDLAQTGMIRRISIKGTRELLERQSEVFERNPKEPKGWHRESGERLAFSQRLWPLVDFSGVTLCVSYFDSFLTPSLSYRNPFVEIPLSPRRKVVVERVRVMEKDLSPEEAQLFSALFLSEPKVGISPKIPEGWSHIFPLEQLPSGLSDFF